MENTAKVLNGEVKAGDSVAYATNGYCMEMHLATVLEVTEVTSARYPYKLVPALRVDVTGSTGGWKNVPRTTIVRELGRVVKLNVISVSITVA